MVLPLGSARALCPKYDVIRVVRPALLNYGQAFHRRSNRWMDYWFLGETGVIEVARVDGDQYKALFTSLKKRHGSCSAPLDSAGGVRVKNWGGRSICKEGGWYL